MGRGTPWRWLRDRRFSAYKFRRHQLMGAHTLDFFCNEAKLHIDRDGSQHGHPEHTQADAERDRWLEERGIKVLRYWNGRLHREKQVVRDAICQALLERAPQPLPDDCRPGVIGAKGSGESTSHGRFALLPHPIPLPLGEGARTPRLVQPGWSDYSRSVAFTAEILKKELLFHLILNAHSEPLDFELPPPGQGAGNSWRRWRRWIDTAPKPPQDIVYWEQTPAVPGLSYRAEARSVVALYAPAG